MPGDPITNLLGEYYVMTEESLQELREKWDLMNPFQYNTLITGMVYLDLTLIFLSF